MWLNKHPNLLLWSSRPRSAPDGHRYLRSSRQREFMTTCVVVVATLAFLALVTFAGMTLIAAG